MSLKNYPYFILLFILLLTIVSYNCKKDTSALQIDNNKYFTYYPVNIGSSWYYDIDSLVIYKTVNGPQIDTSHYLVKESIIDTFRINGNLIYRLEKYERLNLQDSWNIKSVYSIQLLDNQIIRTEENQKFIKMIFPLAVGIKWDGNLYVDKQNEIQIGGESLQIFKDWDSKVLNFNDPFNNGWMKFDSTCTIEIAKNETLIDVRDGYEVYAKNFGLVYRYLKVLDTQCKGNPIDCKDVSWEYKADKGFIVKQKLTGFKW